MVYRSGMSTTPNKSERGFRIHPPPGMTAEEWARKSAGFVGDYRPLAERRGDKEKVAELHEEWALLDPAAWDPYVPDSMEAE